MGTRFVPRDSIELHDLFLTGNGPTRVQAFAKRSRENGPWAVELAPMSRRDWDRGRNYGSMQTAAPCKVPDVWGATRAWINQASDLVVAGYEQMLEEQLRALARFTIRRV